MFLKSCEITQFKFTLFCENFPSKMARDEFGKKLRQRIIDLYSQGSSQKDISELLSIHKSSVSRIIKRNRETGIVEVIHKGGVKKKTTPRQDAYLLRAMRRDPFLSATQLQGKCNLEVSTRTIRRRMFEAGYRAMRPAKKPLVSERNRVKRLQFATAHRDWTQIMWRRVLFSDESKFNMKGADGNIRVRRPPGARDDYRYCRKTVKYGGGSIMVWGAFSYTGVAPLHRIEGIMNAGMYKDILSDVMLPYAEWEMPIRWIFQQDNDPKHTAKIVKNWFSQNGVEVMEWPPQSPDLNPIENLWHIVDRQVDRSSVRNKEDLYRKVKAAWDAIDEATIHRLIDSMSRRCLAVVQNNGFPTKY